MVRYIQITQVPPERLALWRSWLSPQRRKRAGRMPDDRETVCGEGLARELLAAALHCPPEEVALRYDAQGKPLTDGLYLSISHSRGLAACAVADRPVGLDVELVRPAPRRVWEHLSPEERVYAADVGVADDVQYADHTKSLPSGRDVRRALAAPRASTAQNRNMTR